MKTCLFVNARSGGWDRWRDKLDRLAAQTGAPVLSETKQRALPRILEDVCREGFHRMIVAGGDGTLSRIVNHNAAHLDALELALIPTGTGNDLARSIGIFGESLDDAWNWAVTRPALPIDLVRVTSAESHYLVNAATGGFGGIVSTDVTSDDKHRWGAFAYWMTAFFKLVALEEFDVRLELDSEIVSLSTYGLAITNGRYVGGGFPVAPTAVVNDGMLDVTVVSVLPALELLAAGVDFARGEYNHSDRVLAYRSSRLKVHAEPTLPYSFDGEPTRSMDATFEVVPNALQIVCGPRALRIQNRKHEDQFVT